MIDMFTNYQNLSEYYIPNNLSKYLDKPISYTKLNPTELTKPYELYNAKGELEGYYWYYGQSINLDFTITGEIVLKDNSENDSYISVEDYLSDKSFRLRIYNFRYEIIDEMLFPGVLNPIFEIDSEKSKKYAKGIYYCSLEIIYNDICETLFGPEDCKLLVK